MTLRTLISNARSTVRIRPAGLSGGARRVWLLTAAMAAVAVATFGILGLATAPPVLDRPSEIPPAVLWLLGALAFFVAEAAVIHLHIGRSAHSFSMSEIPLIFGLFYFAPVELLTARFVGAALALAISRRQRSVKLAFNLAQFMLSSIAAVLVLRGLLLLFPATIGAQLGPAEWTAAIAATLVENFVGVMAVAAAISLAEGASQFRRVPEMMQTGVIVATTNASLALLAITVASDRIDTVVLFAVPVLTAFFAYRAYIDQRQQHRGLEMLYESTRILQRSPQVDSALTALLEHVRSMFRAEVAEITLLPVRASEQVLRTAVGAEGVVSAMQPVGTRLTDPLLERAVSARRAFIAPDPAAAVSIPADPSSAPGGAGPATAHAPEPGTETPAEPAAADPPVTGSATRANRFRNAMIAPLIGESRIVGAIVVANRLSDISTFDADELKLFETLASHTAIALENGQLEQSLAQLSELKEELHHQAFHDALTGLANRTLFTERVAARLARPDPPGSVPVVLFLDLDDFKLVNDTLGHAAGDALLRAVGDRIRQGLRADDIAARLGGDEFAILVSDHPDLSTATHIANRLIASFDSAYLLGTTSVNVRASIGVAAALPDTDTADELMRNADVAMYQAKAQGKGRVAVFEPQMAVAVATRHQLTASLQRAVAAEEFFLNYQPIVAVASGTVVGVEALVRWEDPARGTIWPIEFIPLAEQSDVILRVGRWVLQESCRQAKLWEPVFGANGRPWMSVNISTRQLKQPRFVEEVMEIVTASGLPPSALNLEMTETGMLQDIPDTLAKLRRLRDFGLGVSVDDFGTGYSSLSYLQRFPVTSLKIARDFVHVDEAEPDSWELASAIISMGRALGLEVVAEGVEHLYQLNRLQELGCEYAQGYYLARPARAERIDQLLVAEGTSPPRLWTTGRGGITIAAGDDDLTAARSG